MPNRAVVFTMFLAFLVLGVVLFLWVTGMSVANLVDRLSLMWNTATMSIRKSNASQKAMVICVVLITGGVFVVAKSIRRV